MTELFNVVFAGEIVGRADPAVVRANVGKLFNASEAVLDRLFSGQPVAVKKMVDRATAMKIRALLKQAGAEARMVQVDAQGSPLLPASAAVTPASEAVAVAVTSAAVPAGSMAARLQRMAEAQAQEDAVRTVVAPAPHSPSATSDAPAWGISPAGARMSEPDSASAAAVPDVSSISLAAPGADILTATEKAVITPVQVDISGITVAAVGSDVLNENEKQKIEAVQVDISGISVAEVGAPLDEIRAEKVLVNPDISHLTLVKE